MKGLESIVDKKGLLRFFLTYLLKKVEVGVLVY